MYKTQANFILIIVKLVIITNSVNASNDVVSPGKTLIYGPGIIPDLVVTPARYFFIHAVNARGKKFTKQPPLPFTVHIDGKSPLMGKCHYNLNIIDRGDGSFIVRYKIAEMCQNVKIEVKYNGTHVADSPYNVKGSVYSESCRCPQELRSWMRNYKCPTVENRITTDLKPFKNTNFSGIRENLLKKYNMPGSVSLCNYVVKNNEIYRKCYGKYVGFKMFMDALLLSITRLVELPDFEFFLNLGDYPLVKKGGQTRTTGPYPIFSWCGSEDTFDIVLPTYDITQSTLENMGSVMLDILSVQKSQYPWKEKEPKGFWRGRDSRSERLDLIDISRKHPDLINASITNFFFYRDEEDKYGPRVAHISFMDFFKYKYQINIDGTIAAYRLPYLLGGDSVVLKQDSPFYEHFYDKLQRNKHFIPIKRDLSDLVEKIHWAQDNDDKVREIIDNARRLVEENLLPTHIYCYHVLLFKEWSQRLVSAVTVFPDMEKVEEKTKCNCHSDDSVLRKDEL